MLSHHRTLIFVFVVGRLFFVHCLQPGHANLGGCLKFFAGLDFEEIMSKKASATLTGRMLRNQLYYEIATDLVQPRGRGRSEGLHRPLFSLY